MRPLSFVMCPPYQNLWVPLTPPVLADGKNLSEIAARMHIVVSTVEAHRCNIMLKLDLHSVAGLMRYAIREGLTSP